MRILFFITGIGYGDSIRQHAIIKQLKDSKILIATYHKGYHYFKNKYPTTKMHSYKFPDTSFKLKPFIFFLDNLFLMPFQFYDLIKFYFITNKFKENFLEYLKVSKAVITLAGHSTLSEIVVHKKPALIFPIQNHLEQYINGYVLQKNNLALVKNLKEINPEILKKHIQEFLKKENKFENNLKKLNLTGNGAKQAAEIIMKK